MRNQSLKILWLLLFSSISNGSPMHTVVAPFAMGQPSMKADSQGTLHVAHKRGRQILYISYRNGHWRDEVIVYENSKVHYLGDPVLGVNETGDKAVLVWEEDGKLNNSLLEISEKISLHRIDLQIPYHKHSYVEVPDLGFGSGHFFVLWTDLSPRSWFSTIWDRLRSIGGSHPDTVADLWLSRFKPDEKAVEAPIKVNRSNTCVCCRPDIAFTSKDQVAVAYRSSVDSVKEIKHLTSMDGGKSFTERQVSNDIWRFEGCPTSGPQISFGVESCSMTVWYGGKKHNWSYSCPNNDLSGSFDRSLGPSFQLVNDGTGEFFVSGIGGSYIWEVARKKWVSFPKTSGKWLAPLHNEHRIISIISRDPIH
jgi:hypothetical protein